MGSPWAFFVAVALVITWAVAGPATILTFLMVFLIQNTQNRDAKAIQLKLDELIRGVEGARTKLVHLEDLSDDELSDLQEQFKRLHQRVNDHEQSEHRAA